MYNRVFNFGAGPAALPVEVLEKARDEMMNFNGSGMSVMELSHRSKAFEAVIAHAESKLRQIMGIPDTHEVLFLQGGASLQFAMIPMNLYLEGKPVDIVNTGSWTQKAIEELDKVATYNVVSSSEDKNFNYIPSLGKADLNPNASYVHVCSNNTIFGTQWASFPDTGDVPLVADMSSDILSRPIDVSKFGVIFAGAQKNIGPSGVTLVIIRKDLIERADKSLPTMLQFRTHAKNKSLYNTPPTFGIYMIGLVLDWIESLGGLRGIENRNEEKATTLYNAIDASKLFYCPNEQAFRSKMNVVFRSHKPELDEQFLKEASAAGLKELKGHRSVGGFRASIYNATSLEGVKALVQFMQEFEQKNG
ncbi:MAG: 3-phosphoserine/phosphohydroxythreonine transaminase [Candidatus Margulisiibacteriota bacterium]